MAVRITGGRMQASAAVLHCLIFVLLMSWYVLQCQ